MGSSIRRNARVCETMLDAGLREGLPMPFECRNGGCGLCKADLLRGEVSLQLRVPVEPKRGARGSRR